MILTCAGPLSQRPQGFYAEGPSEPKKGADIGRGGVEA